MKRFRIPIVLFCLLFLGVVLYNPSDILAAFTKNQNSLNQGLVGYWTFDGKDTHWTTGRTDDLSGNGNPGTLQNMSTTTTPGIGKLGQGFNFTGATQMVTVSDPGAGSVLDFANGSKITIGVWFYPTSFSNGAYGSILMKWDGSSLANYQIAHPAGCASTCDVEFYYTSGSGAASHTYQTDSAPLRLNTWNHILVSYTFGSSGTIVLYVNGVPQSASWIAGTGNSAPDQTDTQVEIGGDTCSGCSNFDEPILGKLDDVRLYNRALSASDVAQLYKMGGAKFAVSPTQPSLPLNRGLVGYWTMDAKDVSWTTGRVTDMSGNANVGTFQNMSTATSPAIGKLGQGLFFSGTNSYVDISAIDSTFPRAQGSLSLWLKLTPRDSTSKTVLGIRTDGSNEIEIVDFDGTSGLNFRFKYRTLSINTTAVIDDDPNWHLVSMTWDTTADEFKAFVDGAQVGTTQTTLGVWASPPVASYLGNNTAPNNPLYGTIDDVRVYSRVLTPTEIADLYRLGQPKFGASPTTYNNPLNRGLVAYWDMDGKNTNWSTGRITDASGNGVTGAIQGLSTTTSPVIGKIGQALYFDGNNYVDAGNVSNLNMGTNDWTVAYWIKSTSTSVILADVVAKTDYLCGGQSGWSAEVSGTGRIRGVLGGPALCRVAPVDDGTVVMDGTWHHVVVVFNRASNMLRYADGQLTGTAYDISGLNGVNITTSQQVCFAARCPGGPSEFTAGTIDDLRVYNRALTATEVLQLYKMGQSRAQ